MGRPPAASGSSATTDGDGKADRRVQFASGFSSSEVALFDGYLYTETNTAILRFPFQNGTFAPAGKPDTVAEDLPGGGSHPVKTFAIDRAGNMYVNVGSATNSCQANDREKEVAGQAPVRRSRDARRHLEVRRTQEAPDAERRRIISRAAFGTRSASRSIPLDGKLWTTQHGRDELGGEPASWSVAAEVQRRESGRRAAAGQPGRRLRLAVLLLRGRRASPRARAGVRRRRQEDRRVRAEEGAGRSVPGALGAERAHVLHGLDVSRRSTRMARSSRSTDRGTARLSRRRDTTSCSSR